jgi:hypothetical protein
MSLLPRPLLTACCVAALATTTFSSGQQDALRAAMTAEAPPANAIWLDSLDLSKMVQRRQTPRAGQTLARGRGRGAGTREPARRAGLRAAARAATTPITLGGITTHTASARSRSMSSSSI